jgi:hypothetical protein
MQEPQEILLKPQHNQRVLLKNLLEQAEQQGPLV